MPMAARACMACGARATAYVAGEFCERAFTPCDNARARPLPPMIGRLSGTLLEKNPPQILLDVQGVAYEVDVPMSTFYNLPATGERVTLFTHLVVREDARLLFGFGSDNERRAFRQLLKLSGIGARTALSVLSGLSVAELVQAISMQEPGRLTKIPGIGKKT